MQRVLRKPPQFTRLKRHASTLLHHSTPRKLANLIAIEFQRILRRTEVFGYPYYVIIDTGNVCNLRCPLCPTGAGTGGRNRKLMTLDDFKKVVDRFAPYAYEVTLYNWGEPLLNPNIMEMIRYCVDENLGTNMSTNLSVAKLDVDSLIRSGLEYLVVSMDGTTQDVYSIYRVRGNIDLVVQNLKEIIKRKKELKSRTPVIEWQFMPMKHNHHQIEDAKKMAKEIGVDLLRFIPVGIPFDFERKKELADEWYPPLEGDPQEEYILDRFMQKPIEGGCFYLYRSTTINPEGAVSPCCMVYKARDDFGNMMTTDFSDIWNNEFFESGRSLFSKNGSLKHKKAVRTICDGCPVFVRPKRSSSKRKARR
jgi:MoaA/NifB/PqqE/SkfB family radical SAM enzyme